MIRTCLFLLAGVYALQLSSFTVRSNLLLFLAVLIAGSLSRRPIHALLCAATGLALFAVASFDVSDSRLEPKFSGDSMVVEIRIIEFPKLNQATVTFVGEALHDARIPPRIRVSWFEPPVALRLGDVWQLEVRLKRPRGNANPGLFDYEAWLFRERIAATGYVVGGHRNHLRRSQQLGWRDQFRQRFVDRLSELVPDQEVAAVLAAISVGARHLMSAEQWQRYARTGTSHLMAISGLHVGLAAGGAFLLTLFISGVCRLHGNHHDLAVLVSLLAAVAYAYLSGFGIPSRRAVLMIVFLAVAALTRRQVRALNVLVAACLLVIAVDPLASMAPGFKLSFAAVLVLIWLARRRAEWLQTTNWIKRLSIAARSLGRLQILLLFGLLPLTVLIFQRAAIAAPPVNFFAVPLFCFVTVPLTLLGLVLGGPLHGLGDQALLLAADSLVVLERGISLAASTNVASVSIATVSGFGWLYLFTPLLLVVLPPGWPGRWLAWVAVVSLLLYRPADVPSGCFRVDVLDVGQGLASIVRTRRHVAVYDTGPAFGRGESMGSRVLLPYLSSIGVLRIDQLIVSHSDMDHAGGLDDLVAGIPIDGILSGEPVRSGALTSKPCETGLHWQWDGIHFRVVHPARGEGLEGNDSSCVLLVSSGDYSLALTGDIERSVEQRLERNSSIPQADVVVVPHHGSGTSSSAQFVRALSPSMAIISAGYGNRWGFPKPDVVARWETVGAKVLETGTSGAISVQLCEQSGVGDPVQHRLERRRIFHEL